MLRSALGGVLAVGLVSGGIVTLQWLVPADKGTPAVVTDPSRTSAPPTTPPASGSPSTAPASTAPAQSGSPTAAGRPAITVLNNSRVTGLAAKAAGDFQRGGWRISGTGNLGGRLSVVTVYFGEGQRPAAEALRTQFPAIKEIAPRYPGLPGEGGLTVVVTRDYPR